jgi:Armadillo/beta-catenin-like repeat
MAKVLEALIAKGRRVRRPREQKEVAFGLADLSTHEELHDRIVKKGGVRTLIELLRRSQDAEAQRFSALAIANCASSIFTRVHIVEDGALEPMIALIVNEETDLIVRQYCAMAIGNLAAEPDNHEDIVKMDGIAALILLLRAEDTESGRYAAFALSNLAANANHREQIATEGGIPALVGLACCEDINAQRQALAALRGMCITPGYRIQVIRDGFLDPLVLMARTDDMELLREIAAAFNCLSAMEENKVNHFYTSVNCTNITSFSVQEYCYCSV